MDCTLSLSLCRKCMRESHICAPLHRIETWNGAFFRPASLWEVGTFLLVRHHDGEGLCDHLQFQRSFLDTQQNRKDEEEQRQLQKKIYDTEQVKQAKTGPGPEIYSGPGSTGPSLVPEEDDVTMTSGDDNESDTAFEAGLDGLLNNSTLADFANDNFDTDAAEADIQNVVKYLGPLEIPGVYAQSTAETHIPFRSGPALDTCPGPDSRPETEPRPSADGLNNAYVRVLHTNGIHHIAMVTCTCHGQDKIPLDLVACRLLPASFIRIRTIFTTQLMDYFRLCNLELKASAYQFYQLIRRLTLPIGQSELVNLYHEFRRMSRLWRWMKKLKWAGYGHNKQDHLNPPVGSIAIFCPTCPQPTVNLPEDWKLDKNRYYLNAILHIFLLIFLLQKIRFQACFCCRW